MSNSQSVESGEKLVKSARGGLTSCNLILILPPYPPPLPFPPSTSRTLVCHLILADPHHQSRWWNDHKVRCVRVEICKSAHTHAHQCVQCAITNWSSEGGGWGGWQLYWGELGTDVISFYWFSSPSYFQDGWRHWQASTATKQEAIYCVLLLNALA